MWCVGWVERSETHHTNHFLMGFGKASTHPTSYSYDTHLRQHIKLIPIKILRSRLWLGVMVIAVIALGLASRKYTFLFPTFLGKYPGDALWALMIFLGWDFCNPDASISRLAVLALATSCIVEFSQLYQAPWINAIRNTTVGHLVLGSTFSWSDICAYAVGVAFGAFSSVVHRRAIRA